MPEANEVLFPSKSWAVNPAGVRRTKLSDLTWEVCVVSRKPGLSEPRGALSVVKQPTERPASTNSFMEEVCERRNLKWALKRVMANKGGTAA